MKILFDQGTPVPLRRHLHPHVVDTAFELGWAELQNGDLLARAERQGYFLMISTDQNLKYQQNLSHRTISILVLNTTSWPSINGALDRIALEVNNIEVGGYAEIII